MKMYSSLITMTLVASFLVTVLFLVLVSMQNTNVSEVYGETEDRTTVDIEPRPKPLHDVPAIRRGPELTFIDRGDGPENFPRPQTPVQNNHYRPVTPQQIHPRPATPIAKRTQVTSVVEQTSIDPPNERSGSPSVTSQAPEQKPATPQDQRVGAPFPLSNLRSHETAQQKPPNIIKFTADTDLDPETSFRKYEELSVSEKADVVNLNQCTVDVERKFLDPLLDPLRRKQGPVEYVIAHFNKKNDKQLTSSEKFVRKSFKIRNQRSNMFRFARLKIVDMDKNFYRLQFQDYTPYIEEHAPKFDVFTQEPTGGERSQWKEIDAHLFHNSQQINALALNILSPGNKGD